MPLPWVTAEVLDDLTMTEVDVTVVQEEHLLETTAQDVIVEVSLQGPPGPPGPGTLLTVTATAGVLLSGHRAVVADDEGLLIYADRLLLEEIDRPVWLTTRSWSVGDEATVVAYGTVDEPSWAFTPGLPLYLGLNGLLSQIPPITGFLLRLGVAVTATRIFFNPGVPIALQE